MRSTSERQRREFKRCFKSLKGSRLACCGSTNWRKSSPEAAQIRPRSMPESHRVFWRHFLAGCRNAKRQPSSRRLATTALSPELIRKGRFELFFVDLPNQSEREKIFAIHLNRRKRNPAEFDLDRVAAAGRGFSGAEIDAAVQTALYAAYTSKQPLTTQALLDALKATVPLSTTRAEEIQGLREWAKTRAVAASVADARAEGA